MENCEKRSFFLGKVKLDSFVKVSDKKDTTDRHNSSSKIAQHFIEFRMI